jgi:hypothetical protein
VPAGLFTARNDTSVDLSLILLGQVRFVKTSREIRRTPVPSFHTTRMQGKILTGSRRTKRPWKDIPHTSAYTVDRNYVQSRDSSVGIATDYGMDGGGVGVQIPAGARIFSFTLCRPAQGPIQPPMGMGGYFPKGKAAEACS